MSNNQKNVICLLKHYFKEVKKTTTQLVVSQFKPLKMVEEFRSILSYPPP